MKICFLELDTAELLIRTEAVKCPRSATLHELEKSVAISIISQWGVRGNCDALLTRRLDFGYWPTSRAQKGAPTRFPRAPTDAAAVQPARIMNDRRLQKLMLPPFSGVGPAQRVPNTTAPSRSANYGASANDEPACCSGDRIVSSCALSGYVW